ncbi:MAG: hypothetical protein AAF716_17615 [Cyanobacteria bacterium P01_D01_bin.1]
MTTMIAVTQAVRTLREAHELCNLRRADEQFFTEWQGALPELTARETEALERLKRRYLFYLGGRNQ